MSEPNNVAQADHLLLIQSKFYLSACLLAAAAALTSLIGGQVWLSLLTAAICAFLVISKVRGGSILERQQANTWLKWSSLVFAAIILLGLASNEHLLKVWLFSLPLLIFFFFEFKPALGIITVLSLIATAFINDSGEALENLQFMSAYVLYLGISCALVYLREVRRKQLKPLRRTDNLTQAATREHLEDDLTKEIQRSEREGSELAVMALGIDDNCLAKLSTKQKSAVIIELGRLLHNNLRLFDSYYLWDDDEYLIVLPHTSSAQANKIANELRVKVRKEIHVKEEKITISVGIAGLNVGDDAKALPEKAAEALQLSMRKGSNRTQLFRDDASDEMRAES